MLSDDLLAFSFIDGIGEKALGRLNYFENADEVIETPDDDLADVIKSKKALYEIKNNFSLYFAKAEKIKKGLAKTGGVLITASDKRYPERLKGFDKAPYFLYCAGNLKLLNADTTAAITGPRDADAKGLSNAYETAKSLAAEETVVVSGLAVGVDTEAHKAAVKYGKTIAVLPYFYPVYPQQNKALADSIIDDGGLIVAEFFEKTNPKFQLLSRDKIIVGLADKVYSPCIYNEDSGTAYTVNYALQQDKNTYQLTNGKYLKL